ncbi:hypothetical protein K9O30_15035 [Clostridium bowmanii]|uniref:hypothetical protein n=1 Tax=Clostridium bowmanii TaxID=132925 RepID=UPI001C0AD88D|nr:hypothetical protein [Clostridium bowmanii]MBU3190742.1 hypothetical protein [Clostridium bowmanii]MCA1075012.1 hypothetical protein [Clostridium bowmanii]
MNNCFVIQPFDKGKFDSRYEDTFEPAINACKLKAYRIDKDPSVNILIEDIEANIKNSTICFAEITTDNPNVWYELGYAIACNKEVVMVCSDERQSNFPFDVTHRNIIQYKTGSARDYEQLKNNITNRIKAIIKKQNALQQFSQSVIKETEGLSNHEITALVSIMSNQRSDNECVWGNTLQQDMSKNGYNELAVSIAIRKLKSKEYIEIGSEQDINGNAEAYFRITENGQEWIINNENKLQLKIEND